METNLDEAEERRRAGIPAIVRAILPRNLWENPLNWKRTKATLAMAVILTTAGTATAVTVGSKKVTTQEAIQVASLPWSNPLVTTKSDFQKIREKVERDGYFQSEQRGNVIYFRPLYGKAGEIKNGMDDIKAGRVFQGVVLRGADFNSLIGAINQCKPTDKLCQTGAYGAMLETLANKEGQIIAISDPSEFLSIRIRNLIENKKLSKAREFLPVMVTEAQKQATSAEECHAFEKQKQKLAEHEADVKKSGAGLFGGVGNIIRENTVKAEKACKEASTGLVAATKWETEGYEAIILAMDGEDEKALAIARRTLDAELGPFLQENIHPAYAAFERVIVTIAELSVQTKRGVTGVAKLEDVLDEVRRNKFYKKMGNGWNWNEIAMDTGKTCPACLSDAYTTYNMVFQNAESQQG